MKAVPGDLLKTLDEQIERKSLLKHPFYQAWVEGSLHLNALQEYAKQYYKHVLAFPTYLSAVHANCPYLPVRQQILENLIEEERGEKNHPELWLRFGEALGLDREQLRATPALPETDRAVSKFKSITLSRSFVEGVAALYAYEEQVPRVAATKIDGLRKYYNVTEARGLEFFTLHMEVDQWHAQTSRNIIRRYACTPEEAHNVTQAAEESLDALWTLLDGVYANYVKN